MHRTQLFIPDNIHKILKQEAKENGVTLSAYVRRILEEHVLHETRGHTEKGIQTLMRMIEGEDKP